MNTENYNELVQKAFDNNIPLFSHIELTHRCNLDCIHCYICKQNRRDLTTVKFKNVLDELADLGTLYLALTGGEILLHKDFFEIAEYARARGFALRLFTNATLIDREKARRIADLNTLKMEISVYGYTTKVHDAITRVPGSHQRTLQAIKWLSEAGVRIVVKTPVTSINIHEAQRLKQWALDQGLEFDADSVIVPKSDGSVDPVSLRISNQELEHYFRYINSKWKLKDIDTSAPICNAGRGVLMISPYGKIYPCVQIQREAGDLTKQSLHDIWHNSPVLHELRELTLSDLKCGHCVNLSYCNPCLGLSELETGSYTQPSPESCRQAAIRRKVLAPILENKD
ncbi:radical SAM protein [candidate division KSB1 bacterium]|nr:radical SAM protein [candidate division KSB1 bacterium]